MRIPVILSCMRKSDRKPKKYVRAANRLFQEDGKWFFLTREGTRGPFRNCREAEAELQLYASTMSFVEDHQNTLPPGVDCGEVTVVNMDTPALYR